ncbi:hypothetical protein [Sulfitobacter sp. PS-8MA]|uniref:hypothetical protein n=1 Tax=Sulfitobacter sp. PS-8MA TaxID=3237707 RepID=UPI0034C62B5B
MKKAAIAFVALPLLCMGAGYGAGLALAPAPAPEDLAKKDQAQADEVAQGAEGTTPGKKGAAEEQAAQDAAPAELDRYMLAQDRKIVRVGQMTIPVEKTNSISYVVADFALKLESLELAERYRRVEDATRLRDSLLQAMNLAAESTVLRGVAIDSDALSQLLRDLISRDHSGIDDVMFVSLYKQDVARL